MVFVWTLESVLQAVALMGVAVCAVVWLGLRAATCIVRWWRS